MCSQSADERQRKSSVTGGTANEVIAIIPARYGSTRFPGKVLADLGGKPVIRHVYERVSLASSISRIYVATDDKTIAATVRGFGGETVMTLPTHPSGTDRVAEAASIVGGDIVVNVQGDEPLIDPTVIDAVVEKIRGDDGIVCSTAAVPIGSEEEYRNPNAVKVVIDSAGRALYFSRSPIPCYRDGVFDGALLHVGIYCFRRSFLAEYSYLGVSPLERAEKLEQLRILEHGLRIGVVVTGYRSSGIDTPADLERVRVLMAGEAAQER